MLLAHFLPAPNRKRARKHYSSRVEPLSNRLCLAAPTAPSVSLSVARASRLKVKLNLKCKLRADLSEFAAAVAADIEPSRASQPGEHERRAPNEESCQSQRDMMHQVWRDDCGEKNYVAGKDKK